MKKEYGHLTEHMAKRSRRSYCIGYFARGVTGLTLALSRGLEQINREFNANERQTNEAKCVTKWRGDLPKEWEKAKFRRHLCASQACDVHAPGSKFTIHVGALQYEKHRQF